MEFDDYRIDPKSYEKMAKEYYQVLSCDFRFVKLKTNESEKEKILNDISSHLSKLSSSVEFLQRTSRARTHKTIVSRIVKNIELCKTNCGLCLSMSKPAKTNLCETLKTIISECSEIVALCSFLSEFSKNEIDDKVCSLASTFLSVIQDSASLFGECHYRY